MKLAVYFLLPLSFILFYGWAVGSDVPEPREVLQKAASSLSRIQSLSYSAEVFLMGTKKYGDQIAVMTPIRGRVILAKLVTADPIGARLNIEAELVFNAERLTKVRVCYDGYKIRKIDSSKKTFYVNDPDEVGKFLLVGALDLIPNVFLQSNTLEKELSASELRYDGFAVVNNVPCHILHIEARDTTFNQRSWWFIGADDYIPRKIIRLNYSDGQERGQVITLAELKINPRLDDSTFALQSPPDYEVKVFQGFKKAKATLSVGDYAPQWTLRDSEGTEYSLSDFRGKIVLLDFWATWCTPCLQALPKLQEIQEQFNDLEVIGISTWDSGDPVRVMKQKNCTYRLFLNGDEVAKEYGVNGLPTLYLIGKDGKVLYSAVGLKEGLYEEVTRLIQSVVANK